MPPIPVLITSQTILTDNQTVVAEVDAYLATLPLTSIIVGIAFDAFIVPKRINTRIAVNILSESGGTALATPWQSEFIQATSQVDFDAEVNAYLLAQQGGYPGAPRIRYVAPLNGDFEQIMGFSLFNVANGAGANYLLR